MNTAEDRRIFWVALSLVFADRLRSAQKIVARFPSLKDIFRVSQPELEALGVEKERAQRLCAPRLLDDAARVLAKVEKKGCRVLIREDQDYPERLREIFDPPYLLYVAGDPKVLNEPSVAVVGARRPTPFGRAVAEKLAKDLAARGLVVVSGLATGIDSLAHWGALQAGKTVAVLGSGLDDIYPKENKNLFHKIIETGAVVSEFPPGAPPLSFHFPVRNRIISGLALGVVVVEASRHSGSLITARLALEQNREVMAVPGNVTSSLSLGTNWLIKTGAKLVETWVDVVEEFPSPLREELLSRIKEEPIQMPEMSPEERRIYDGLKTDELTHIDELVEAGDASVSEILAHLLNLELKGLVRQAPGSHFQRSL
jgi:DNA processing protein